MAEDATKCCDDTKVHDEERHMLCKTRIGSLVLKSIMTSECDLNMSCS